ncbi:MAG: HAD-IIIA family hydrolase [Bacteroidia bacterium]|nr:HAD-IIIA family hydrolase [Bacteroidia bacterium]
MIFFNNGPIDSTWTLFLDRDGVINRQIPDDYVRTWDDFIFNEGALHALQQFAQMFNRIIIVTNQQGVGKGLMTEADLDIIHQKMLDLISKAGGRIDAIYAATPIVALDDKGMRKPNIGMALQAQQENSKIDFTKSIMIGDSKSDMEFGKNAGMHTIFIHKNKPHQIPENLIDAQAESLAQIRFL